MIARRQNPAAFLMKARDAFAVSFAQTIARIDSEEPEFVEVRRIEHTQNTVVAFKIGFVIPRRDFVESIVDRSEMLPQQRETLDVPVVLDIRNRSLQKNVNSHMEILAADDRGFTLNLRSSA